MNLTSAMYGLSTSVEYSTEQNSLWSKNTQQYISFSEYLKEFLEDEKVDKSLFSKQSKISKNGQVDLISGDINLTNVEANLYGIIKNRNTFTDKLPYKFEQALKSKSEKYDFILIDTSPSASSIINALLVMSSDYFIAPVSPSFFSLQAIDNLSTIFQNWMELLSPYRQTQGFPQGLSFKVKFLGLVIQLAKRFNNGVLKNTEGFSKATEDWIADVNRSVKNFQTYTLETNKSITENEFRAIF
ncbi:MAG: AAA family ATPase [Candidatus Peribacteria bacterium]|nr:MAG: AAA family ATPase [Candidatus Peribacteria bacterium]